MIPESQRQEALAQAAGVPEKPRGISQIVAIGISLLSLAVSCSTLYVANLASFELVLTVGPLTWQPLDADGRMPQIGAIRDRTFPNMTMLAPFTFAHHGALPGVVEDLILTLRDPTTPSKVWRFDPEVEVDEQVFLTDLEPKAPGRWMRARFRQISLAKGQQIDKFILFLPQKLGYEEQTPKPGSYLLAVAG